MTLSGRCYTPEELAFGGQKKDKGKRPLSEEEAEEFWRKMLPKDYSIVKHLEKTLAQISVWSLLMRSQLHRQALMKALDDMCVPLGTSSDNVATIINQLMKLVWKNEKLIIHGERSHSGKQTPIIDEVSRGTKFYTVELVQTRFRIGKEFPRNYKPIRVPVKEAKYGLRYVSTDDEIKMKRNSDQALDKTIPHLYQSFPLREYVDFDGLGEGICDIFKEIDVVIEDEVELASIRDAEPGEQLNINFKLANVMSCHELNEQNEAGDDNGEEYEEENEVPENVAEEFLQFENQHKQNLEETETVNLGNKKCVQNVKINVNLNEYQRKYMILLLTEYIDVFVWKVSDMLWLSTNVVSHKLPINPGLSPMKQKARKFKPELSLKIKEDITKQIKYRLVELTQYPTWLANVVLVAKKDEKIRICVDYRDVNPKDNFLLPNIHILIDNCAKQKVQSFVDCHAGYHQILMDEEDAENTTFITPWGVYHYREMSFGLKNVATTYMRAMTTIFYDMIHKEIEVYIDDVIIKSRKNSYHLTHLMKFFDRLRRYNLKLNPKCTFGVSADKLLGFIVSIRGIDIDPSKIKEIKELPPPKTKKEALADHLTENSIDEEYEPIKTYFPDEEVSFVGKDISEAYPGWSLFFDGAANHQGKGIRAVLVSESGQHYPMAAKLQFNYMNNMAEYEGCILGLNMIEFRHTSRTQNELSDALATIASMIKHPDTDYIDPMDIELKEHPVHCSHVEAEPDGLPLYFDIKKFGVLEFIIIDNGANLNSHLMNDICEQFKITHRNSTVYRPQMNGAVEAISKNIKKILRKMIDNHRVKIPSFKIIQEVELSNAEWVSKRIYQLTLIDEKRMIVICHGQLYRQRIIRAFHNRVRDRIFEIGQLVLKRIFPHQGEYKGKFAPNWQGPYMVRKVLFGGALVLSEMDGTAWLNRSTRTLSRDITCEALVCISVIYK
ncbi:uncharacterized protein [Solanum lycopersicum]|uniref:uncharacterized protein n=1 Tax=Solanum lycopersicum TaxID=4081 RepID=UPI00374A7D91